MMLYSSCHEIWKDEFKEIDYGQDWESKDDKISMSGKENLVVKAGIYNWAKQWSNYATILEAFGVSKMSNDEIMVEYSNAY